MIDAGRLSDAGGARPLWPLRCSAQPRRIGASFHLSDDDYNAILTLRGEHSQLGYAKQLTSVRYLGAFPGDFSTVPRGTAHAQPAIGHRRPRVHPSLRRNPPAASTRRGRYGYRAFTEPVVGFRLSRWRSWRAISMMVCSSWDRSVLMA
ncbi:TPA: DUF4158 domain-containing protein [Pseudomonas aeruginosa]|nr:DUF4158 domain-containing protein [Pseudomonas aeruginosa]